jgi:hypothetical protein
MLNKFIPAFFILLLFQISASGQNQVVTPPDGSGTATVIAGRNYKAGGLKKFFMGKHYRDEWTTPVKVRVLNLDTLGGLTPTEQGGGRQTKTLRLKSARGNEYVLRSIDKDYGGALPEITHGSFIESFAKDQVSTAHPFAAVTIPGMAEAAGIYHTNPIIVLVPAHPRLGEFNDRFANTLCLFEERPDENWENAPNFGNAKDIGSTAKMFEKIQEESDHRVDQPAFVRARLFDIFLGDWGRHDDQWRWAKFQQDGKTIYKPIPRDRDQVYTLFDGLIPFAGTSPEELEHLKSFSGKIKNIKKYNFPARYIDRQLTNEVDKEVWINTAKDLQIRLTDAVIENSIKQMPPELFPLSGPKLISALKQRRSDLVEYAEKYYQWLNEEVEIVGTKKSEMFHIERLGNKQTRVRIFDMNKEGKPKEKPFYSRTFENHLTEEIRLYGLAGNDFFLVDGKVKSGSKIRIIGGVDKDSVIDNGNVSGMSHKTLVYDNPGNDINTSPDTRTFISSDSLINRYDYQGFKYNSGHTIKSPSYSNIKGIHFNAGYTYRRYHWRKEPFSWEQTLKGYYSFSNKSIGGEYEGIFNQVIGKWNILLNAGYHEKLKHYYYGIGNETSNTSPTDYHYFELPLNKADGRVGLQRIFGKHHSFTVSGNYEMVRVLADEPNHFVTNTFPPFSPVFLREHYGGAGVVYAYHNLNSEILPTKGFNFHAGATYTENLNVSNENFEEYEAGTGIYVPLGKLFSLAIKGGASTITGTPAFYHLKTIGGGQSLRGFRRERFRGRSAVYNQNELRWAFNTKSIFFNGKMGFLGFVDQGRVWTANDNSDKWHVGYGGGFFMAPFNKFVIGVNYGISEEGRLFHIKFGKLL